VLFWSASSGRACISFFCTLSSPVLRKFLCHTPLNLSYFLLYLDSLILPLLSYLSVSLPFHLALHSYIFLLLLIFPLLHWHIRFSDNISFSSPCFFSFLSSITLVSCIHPLHPFCLQTLPISFPLSLSAYSSYTLPSLVTT
jgi:hypothetical protein